MVTRSGHGRPCVWRSGTDARCKTWMCCWGAPTNSSFLGIFHRSYPWWVFPGDAGSCTTCRRPPSTAHLEARSRIFYHNVNLMWHALDAQHRELGALLKVSHDATMASGHCVITIGRHEHKLGTPDRRHTAQHIQEVDYQVENVFGNVLSEH